MFFLLRSCNFFVRLTTGSPGWLLGAAPNTPLPPNFPARQLPTSNSADKFSLIILFFTKISKTPPALFTKSYKLKTAAGNFIFLPGCPSATFHKIVTPAPVSCVTIKITGAAAPVLRTGTALPRSKNKF
jgi:hypothetical protein